MPTTDASDADQQRLGHHAREQLAAGRAERAQQRRAPRSAGPTVIEKVLKMMNAPASIDDAGDREQDVPRMSTKLADVGGLLLRLLDAGPHA